MGTCPFPDGPFALLGESMGIFESRWRCSLNSRAGGILWWVDTLDACAVDAGRLNVRDPALQHDNRGLRLWFNFLDGLTRTHRSCQGEVVRNFPQLPLMLDLLALSSSRREIAWSST